MTTEDYDEMGVHHFAAPQQAVLLSAPFGNKGAEREDWVPLTYQECRSLSQNGHAMYYSHRKACVVHLKITSIKMWMKRRDIEVHYKYGIYQYGFVPVSPDVDPTSSPDGYFVRRAK